MSHLLELDHLVVTCTNLKDGVAYVQDTLHVHMSPGGKHPDMGTHNALLGLGDVYLEVIAVDPNADAPEFPRWYNLDQFSGPPKLTHWAARSRDISQAIEIAPDGIGAPKTLSRGDLTWQFAVPPQGKHPFEGAFPAIIDWGDTATPPTRLPETQCRLEVFQVSHDEATDLHAALSAFDGNLERYVVAAPGPAFRAAISTPGGLAVLT